MIEVSCQIQKWGEVEDCVYTVFVVASPRINQRRFPAHDVDYQDVRRQLGSAACLLAKV